MTPGPGSEAAYRVVAEKSENASPTYRVEKTFAASPRTLKVTDEGCERVLKVFKTEAEAKKYAEALREIQKGEDRTTAATPAK